MVKNENFESVRERATDLGLHITIGEGERDWGAIQRKEEKENK